MPAREYRVAASTARRVGLLSAFGALALLATVCTDGDLPGLLKLGILVVGLAGIAAVPVWAQLAGTFVDADGVAIRGWRGTRRYPWPDIQDIRIEANLGGYMQDGAPRQLVVLYDRAGRRVALPHVHEQSLDRLADEVEAMRAAWQQHRGPGWEPVALVQRKVEERRRYTFSSWAVGAIAAMFAAPAAAIVFVIGLFTHAIDLAPPLGWLFQPVAIMVAPVVAFPVTAVVSILLRRRAR